LQIYPGIEVKRASSGAGGMDPCTAFGAIWQMQSLNESSLTSVLAFPLLTAPAYWSALLEISPVLQTDE